MFVAAAVAALALAQGQPVQGQPVIDPRFAGLPETQVFASLDYSPVAVRGGVLLLPLARRSPDIAWPATIALRLGDGRRIEGKVVSIKLLVPESPSWTTPATTVVTVPPTGDSNIALLAPMPTDGDDEIMLGGQELDAIWMNPQGSAIARANTDHGLGSSDSPDLSAPSEYFRTVLQAQRFSAVAPPPSIEGNDALYARAIAGLWSAAIARLAEQDPVTCETVVSDLTGRAVLAAAGGAKSLAIWETSDEELAQLLRILLEPRIDGIVLVEGARTWLDGPLVAWIERDDGESLTLAIGNPRNQPIPVTIKWTGRGDPAFEGDIPPESIELVTIKRPSWESPGGPLIDERIAQAMQERGLGRLLPPAIVGTPDLSRASVESEIRTPKTLSLETPTAASTLLVGVGRVGVRPPGAGFGMFVPPANLAALRSGSLRAPPAEWETHLGLRKRPAGWELIAECRVPSGAHPNTDELTIVLDAGFPHSLRINAEGEVVAGSESVESGTRFHRDSDRWRVCIPLPDEWIAGSSGTAKHLTLSAQRRLSGSGSDAPPMSARIQSAGAVPLSIDPKARQIPLDCAGWELPSVTLGR